jgi:hypothetical protein
MGAYAGNSDTPEIIKKSSKQKTTRKNVLSDLFTPIHTVEKFLFGSSAIYNILITPIACQNKVMGVI